MAEMNVELVAVERQVWSGTATSVIVRTVEGDVGILPGHAPLLAQLKEGFSARIVLEGGEELGVALHGGFLSVTKDRVSILAEDAQLASEIDVAAAQSDYADAERRANGEETADLLRARAQLLAAGHSV
ncbi:F0F1 ATP synthase subunit epsilon [Nakamurella deserti]|uniref:F0F1 ATP synthase subunit epsilon n=1 Tax=Nakamurella deserti TaxID=2164074 RepID=UPI000DBE30A6|nr:F0F1 ATP synthase subunit epsilon [Nakamurella deserti]